MSPLEGLDDQAGQGVLILPRVHHDAEGPRLSGAVTGAGVVTIIMGALSILCGGGFGVCGLFCAGAGAAARQQGNILPPEMLENYGGFFLAALIGIPLGLMIGRIKLLRQLLDPTINLLRPIPVTAWLPLSMIFFGLGPNAAIFLVFLGAFYPILLNTIFGVRSVDVRLFEAAAMLGCSGSAMFRQIVFPASLPSIFNGLRIAHGFAWILIVVGEMTGVPTGLGSVIMDGRTLSRTDLVVTGMIVIGVCGFVTDRIIVVISNRVLQWSPQHHA